MGHPSILSFLSLGASVGIMSHCSTLEAGIAKKCRVSIASPLCIVGSRLTRHLVGRALHLVGVVGLTLLLSLVTSSISIVVLGTLLVVVAGVAATSLLLRRAEFPLLLHLTALAL